jgi:hypothetical protein
MRMGMKICSLYLDEADKEAIEVIGRFLLANGVNVENPKAQGDISHSAVLRHMIRERKMEILLSKAHVINEAFLTGGNS